MSKALLTALVEDADLVADVGVRLGRIKSDEFLTALKNARHALNNEGTSPEEIVRVREDLQKWLNPAVNDISLPDTFITHFDIDI